MEIVPGHRRLGRALRAPAVAIGNFDGVHLGHRRLFAAAWARARLLGGEALVLTFDPHPARLLAPSYAPPLITPLQRKLELIAEAGIDLTVVEPFDATLAALSCEEFVDEVLVRGLGVKAAIVGYDFTFGQRRAGSAATLTALGGARGIAVEVVAPVAVEGIVCSSTKVREFMLEGRIDGARLVLGRDPDLDGEVVRGDGRGRQLGFPTANVRSETELLPKAGVYAGWATHLGDGRRFMAAISVGFNPTFARSRTTGVEAHLLDCDADLYGARLRIAFVARLRDEERFATLAALVAQIGRDVEKTRALLTAVC